MLIESTDTVTIERAEYRQLLADRERLAALEQQLAALKRQRFGASSENADQSTMFGSADIELIEQEIKAEVPVAPKKRRDRSSMRSGHGARRSCASSYPNRRRPWRLATR